MPNPPTVSKHTVLLHQLPSELRNMIYEQAVAHKGPIIINPRIFLGAEGETLRHYGWLPGLLRTCRHARSEARTMYYHRNHFTFEVDLGKRHRCLKPLFKWLSAIGPDACAVLTSLCLDFLYPWHKSRYFRRQLFAKTILEPPLCLTGGEYLALIAWHPGTCMLDHLVIHAATNRGPHESRKAPIWVKRQLHIGRLAKLRGLSKANTMFLATKEGHARFIDYNPTWLLLHRYLDLVAQLLSRSAKEWYEAFSDGVCLQYLIHIALYASLQ